jgi:hypothetical protein
VDESGRYVFRDRLQDYIYDFKRGGVGDQVEHFTTFVLQEVAAPGLQTFDEFETVWKQWILDLDAELKTADKRLDGYLAKGRMAGLKDEHLEAQRWYGNALDIDPDHPDALWGSAAACAALAEAGGGDAAALDSLRDQALHFWRRFAELAAEDDARRAQALERADRIDPQAAEWLDARRTLVGGMAALARDYDGEGMPRLAMRCARGMLGVEPFDASARALLTRLERETGLSTVRWRRLFNGFDLDGWYGVEGDGSFFVEGGALVNDSRRAKGGRATPGGEGREAPAAAPAAGRDDGAITYQALLLQRKVDGDFTLEARLQTGPDWQIAGLIFGGRDTDHYEAVVLRNRPGDEKGPQGGALNNVDFGSFSAGTWAFRGDGSVKSEYDPSKGVLLRVDVRGREVRVTIDGQAVEPIVGKKVVPSIKYPLGALRGDVGLLGSRGVTRFTDIRLRAGAER